MLLGMFVLLLAFLLSVIWFWKGGFFYIKKQAKKTEDIFNWDKEINTTAGRDGWDDNLVHTEGEI